METLALGQSCSCLPLADYNCKRRNSSFPFFTCQQWVVQYCAKLQTCSSLCIMHDIIDWTFHVFFLRRMPYPKPLKGACKEEREQVQMLIHVLQCVAL